MKALLTRSTATPEDVAGERLQARRRCVNVLARRSSNNRPAAREGGYARMSTQTDPSTEVADRLNGSAKPRVANLKRLEDEQPTRISERGSEQGRRLRRRRSHVCAVASRKSGL